MAPTQSHKDIMQFAGRAIVTTGSAYSSHYLAQRDLTVQGAQGVTLGVIAAYVVGIGMFILLEPGLEYIRGALMLTK